MVSHTAVITLLMISSVVFMMQTAVEVTAASRFSSFQFRDKARIPRGFKNERLSTARGFGKRGNFAYTQIREIPPDENSAETQKPGRKENFPVEWLVEQIQSDPGLAKVFIQKFVDLNQDGEISEDELVFPLITAAKMNANVAAFVE